jgi:hypothetical protein
MIPGQVILDQEFLLRVIPDRVIPDQRFLLQVIPDRGFPIGNDRE